ncbi:MFS transporter [Nocardia rhamnosiphila]
MATAATTLERSTVRTIMWRILPFVFVCYIVNYIDRANLAFASIHMRAELGLTSQAFGLAAGLFFIGYFFFEVPSNVLMQKVGARIWIARILVTWGVVSASMMFVQNPTQLYILRFLLGVAEAGFYPAIVVYLTYWFRKKELATAMALFLTAIPLSYVLASPLSALIIEHISWAGISGWRWMFMLEAAPAIIMGVVAFFFLVEKPANAQWLTDEQKRWLQAELDGEESSVEGAHQHTGIWRAITNPKVLYLALIYLICQAGVYGISYWMPQILRQYSDTISNVQVGLVNTIPYLLSMFVMVWWAKRSDRTGERKIHTSIALGIGGVAMGASAFTGSLVFAVFAISIALAGLYAFRGPYWSIPTLFLTRSTAAISIAAINAFGNLGGFVGPYGVGLIEDLSGSKTAGLIFLSSLILTGTVLCLLLRLPRQAQAPVAVADKAERV